MTNWVNLIVEAGMAASVSAAAVWAWRRQHGERRVEAGAESRDFDADRYLPLVRLLNGEDDAFVTRHCKDAAALSAWRRSRSIAVRGYLADLKADFRSLHREARVAAAQTGESAEAVIVGAASQYLRFWSAFARLRVAVAAQELGLGHVDATRILGLVETYRSGVASTR